MWKGNDSTTASYTAEIVQKLLDAGAQRGEPANGDLAIFLRRLRRMAVAGVAGILGLGIVGNSGMLFRGVMAGAEFAAKDGSFAS